VIQAEVLYRTITHMGIVEKVRLHNMASAEHQDYIVYYPSDSSSILWTHCNDDGEMPGDG